MDNEVKTAIRQCWLSFFAALSKAMTENVLVLSTWVATTLTLIKYLYPSHYAQAIEVMTTWLFIKKDHPPK